ncbi:DUF3027 domain-containing protein [Mycobacterium sp. CBMA293]|nr:DUF3027 domain-containing protein [Mycolicibacterium sp. CBMA 360]MUL62461.1 DUF3027 domain-containing protein [Mycolicibacterium sp. CBMA 335]MUL74152.1 DUF3027 domain-containing protein [Mycolicibacterium sp. CBMA 311]MUL96846.1 DUF3027 domain-containing protein [Mycolicibacterium sp. CBMA 230]MUM03893.1 hypothetical protein [Mycolicibacterium sp. CBMA 213]MUM13370.1 DUF3027 domain-containing protein [Mycolicibacterium sp. CBMA 293]
MDTPNDTESAALTPDEPAPAPAQVEVPNPEPGAEAVAEAAAVEAAAPEPAAEPEPEVAAEVSEDTEVAPEVVEATEATEANDSAEPVEAVDEVEQPDLTPILMAAVDQARAAIIEFSGDGVVGDYLGATFDDPASVTHRFLASLPGYHGWQWAVVLATYPGADHTTVSEVVLVPGPDALLAPAWLPWNERVQPGDLSPGDLLAPPAGDPRLVPGYVGSGDPELDDVAAEIGFGRKQVLSDFGRTDAAQRWHDGDFGPGSAMARATRRTCRGCGFYVPLSGSLGLVFGVCANELSADGRVVSAEYGCGAHSDTPPPDPIGSPAFEPFDDGVVDVG